MHMEYKEQASCSLNSLDVAKAANLVEEAYRISQVAKFAVELYIYMPMNPKIFVKIQWDDVDLDNALLRSRSGDNLLLIPISTRAIRLLEALKSITGANRFVFSKNKTSNNHIAESQLTNALRKTGFYLPVSKILELAKYTLVEKFADWDAVAIQFGVISVSESIWRDDDRLDERRVLTQWWADYIDNLRLSLRYFLP
ncbi:site-specific integrase [Alkalimarinus alittae]|uniref:Uncharacterized protein n=1 Tax=Alkalimarinus alittae TaxID=2961619 RepID=A0ABY6N734_9ALTE|nr:hypothetical protein [Alkalimarinus alittae]UZE97906.1 hypothetical protein NKI27_09290 [Alkalimarinus alittae]